MEDELDLFAEIERSNSLRSSGQPYTIAMSDGYRQIMSPPMSPPMMPEDDKPGIEVPGMGDEPGTLAGSVTGAAGRAAAGGLRDLGQQGIEVFREMGGLMESAFGIPEGSVIENLPAPLSAALSTDLPQVEQPKSAAEGFARGMTQFAAGMAAAPIKGAGIGTNILRSAFADSLFDPEQGNLSTFIKDMGVENEFIDLLDSRVGEEADAAERLIARAQQAGEGALIGVPLEGLALAARNLKKTPEAFQKVRSMFGKPKSPDVEPPEEIPGVEPFTSVIFEVAPDPKGDPNLVSRWDGMSNSEKFRISDEIGREVAQSEVADLDASGEVVSRIGSYLDDTNPSFAVRLGEGDPLQLAKNLGFRLDQDSMMITSSRQFEGSSRSPLVAIDVGDLSLSEIDKIYQTIRSVEGVPQISGQSTIDGTMTIVLEEGSDADQIGAAFKSALGDKYNVEKGEIFVSFPEKKEYDYDNPKNVTGKNRKAVRERYRNLRTETQQKLQEAIAGTVSDTRAGRATSPDYDRTIEGSLLPDGRIELTHYSWKKLDRNDPSLAGTGADRTKRNRPSRGTWFGVTKATEDPYVREPMVGKIENRFSADPNELYVISDHKNPMARKNQDPLGVWSVNPDNSVDYDSIMEKVRAGGYKGFIINSPAHGKIAIIDDVLESINGGSK